jgi:hypothetical protein
MNISSTHNLFDYIFLKSIDNIYRCAIIHYMKRHKMAYYPFELHELPVFKTYMSGSLSLNENYKENVWPAIYFFL